MSFLGFKFAIVQACFYMLCVCCCYCRLLCAWFSMSVVIEFLCSLECKHHKTKRTTKKTHKKPQKLHYSSLVFLSFSLSLYTSIYNFMCSRVFFFSFLNVYVAAFLLSLLSPLLFASIRCWLHWNCIIVIIWNVMFWKYAHMNRLKNEPMLVKEAIHKQTFNIREFYATYTLNNCTFVLESFII